MGLTPADVEERFDGVLSTPRFLQAGGGSPAAVRVTAFYAP
ncbi:MAG: hypothetical protein WKF31_03445 [Thermoleophilaceae bacterium]